MSFAENPCQLSHKIYRPSHERGNNGPFEGFPKKPSPPLLPLISTIDGIILTFKDIVVAGHLAGDTVARERMDLSRKFKAPSTAIRWWESFGQARHVLCQKL